MEDETWVSSTEELLAHMQEFNEKEYRKYKSVTDDCLSTMNDTNLEKMRPKNYDRVPVEEFNEDDIEIIWGDEWQEVV